METALNNPKVSFEDFYEVPDLKFDIDRLRKDLVNVNVKLGGPIYKEPVDLFVPFRQPLPNAECFAEHLLDQCRRLVLGRG